MPRHVKRRRFVHCPVCKMRILQSKLAGHMKKQHR